MTDSTHWSRELRHSWPLLRAGQPTEIATAPLPVADDLPPVRLGVDGRGARHLLVPLGEEDVRPEPVEGAVLVEIRTYTFGRRPLRYLAISCVRPDLFDLFDDLLVDVLLAADGAFEGRARAALEIVGRWRTLLAARRPSLLTLVAQMSLFGELSVLDLVTRDRTLDVSWWRGPLREPHDIVLPERAIEVKSIGATSTSIEVHGIRQLEAPGRPLALVLATVVQDVAGTRLPVLVDRIIERATNRGEAVRLLAAVGYVGRDADRYQERFVVRGLACVEMSEAVPRITPASFGEAGLPVGIDRLTYTVDMRALDPLVARGEAALLSWLVAG